MLSRDQSRNWVTSWVSCSVRARARAATCCADVHGHVSLAQQLEGGADHGQRGLHVVADAGQERTPHPAGGFGRAVLGQLQAGAAPSQQLAGGERLHHVVVGARPRWRPAAASGPARAERTTTGVLRRRASARISFRSPRPSSSGIITSVTTQVDLPVLAAGPGRPGRRERSVRSPSSARIRARRDRIAALSSATRIDGPGRPATGDERGASGAEPPARRPPAPGPPHRRRAGAQRRSAAASSARPAGARPRRWNRLPGREAAVTAPSIARAASATIDRPIPVPSMLRPPLLWTRWKRSKTRSTSDSGMPTPVSAPGARSGRPRRPRRTSTDPSRVNLTALATRFSTIFSHSSGSTSTMPSAGSSSRLEGEPARAAADPNGLQQVAGELGQVGGLRGGVRARRPRSGRRRGAR